ncbi:hypothetical protein E9529_14835 [Blastococcus sp. KM273128]|uniref:hypothetical protein n=1 Tax=Blastococcus sp. KM273128 TaxID=2570314 RepID=UPI001F387340|nr:hypothetical protein [Blastococcus sp. KM273128]MCF6745523.1 hypothetical protein [Blastococcus sp. KM273128]
MESTAPRQLTAWLVQPLVDAGLDPGEIQAFVTRLGFEAVVAGDRGADKRILDVVGNQPCEVRAAWLEVIDRMTSRRLPGC